MIHSATFHSLIEWACVESTGCHSREVKNAVPALHGLTGSGEDRLLRYSMKSAMIELCLGIWEST